MMKNVVLSIIFFLFIMMSLYEIVKRDSQISRLVGAIFTSILSKQVLMVIARGDSIQNTAIICIFTILFAGLLTFFTATLLGSMVKNLRLVILIVSTIAVIYIRLYQNIYQVIVMTGLAESGIQRLIFGVVFVFFIASVVLGICINKYKIAKTKE